MQRFTSLTVSSVSLPRDYIQLSTLKELSLTCPSSPIGSIPPVVCHMTSLEQLKLLYLEIIYPPRQIQQLTSMTEVAFLTFFSRSWHSSVVEQQCQQDFTGTLRARESVYPFYHREFEIFRATVGNIKADKFD